MLAALSSDEFLNAGIAEEASSALRKSPSAEDMLYGLFDPAESHGVLPSYLPGLQREEDLAQSPSEEEYEEAIVEPRALNEITAVTDKTSPWSSFLSESEREAVPEAQTATDGEYVAKESAAGSRSVSDVIQGDPLKVSGVTGSGSSPFREDVGDGAEEGHALEAGEAAEPVEPTEIRTVGRGRPPKVQEAEPEEPSSARQGGGDSARPLVAAPEVAEGTENLQSDPQRDRGIHVEGEGGPQPCPASPEMVQQTEASSGEDEEDLPEEFSMPTVALYPFFRLVKGAKRPLLSE